MSDQDGPVARLRISNDSDGLLELVVEPYLDPEREGY
jgi:hypothetical protein